MPTRAPRICSCGKVVASGSTCACVQRRAAERRAAFDAQRPSSTARGYDRAWARVRGAFLKANPVCSAVGCGAPATEADHVHSVRERPDLRLVWSNLRALCKPCHSRRTARDQGFARPKAVEARGVVANSGKGASTDGGTFPRDRDESRFSGGRR